MSMAGGANASPPWEPGGSHGSSAPGVISRNRKSSTLVKLGITAAVAGVGIAVFAAMDDDDEPTHAAVCVDRETNTRVDDDECDRDGGGGGFGWFFFAYGHSAPRVGGPVTGGGSYTPPANGTYVRGGVPAAGGVVTKDTVKGGTKTTTRGGFGGSAKGSGG